MRHIVHQPRSAFYESGCLGMQPKMGGKLLLKLNIGTRPIANKYREGKMKSTLKRKLIVRETVEREAHGISNALLRFRQFCSVTCIVRIRMDRLCLSSDHRTVAFPSSVRQQLLELSDEPRKKVAGFGWCYSLWCANLDPTEESRHMLFWAGLSLPSLFSTMVDCTQCAWTEACCWGEECTHCAKVVGGHMISCDPSWNTDQGV